MGLITCDFGSLCDAKEMRMPFSCLPGLLAVTSRPLARSRETLRSMQEAELTLQKNHGCGIAVVSRLKSNPPESLIEIGD